MALKDTLANIKAQDEQKAQFEKDKPNLIKEWQSAVDALFNDIRGYLADYVEAGSISIDTRNKTVSEPQLGQYNINLLVLTAGSKSILVSPTARMAFGVRGRVDLHRKGHSDDSAGAVFLHVTDVNDNLLWVVNRPSGTPVAGNKLLRANNAAGTERVPLNKEIFETYFESLISL